MAHEDPTLPREQASTLDAFEELPPRPRRRLLEAVRKPLPLALTGVLLTVCGFIGGVLVEKGQSSSTGATSSGSLTSRFAALRSGGTSGGGFAGGAGAGGFARAASAGSAGAGAFANGRAAAGGGQATIGQVAYVSGHTLYVTGSEGATVKVTTSATSTVSRTVTASIKAIHPGEIVIVTGSRGAHGAIDAASIRVGEVGGGGDLQALFAAGGGLRGQLRESSPGGIGGGNGGVARTRERPVLFGK